MVTFRLGDALPQEALREIEATPSGDRPARAEGLLDACLGSCCLRLPECAEVVEAVLLHMEGTQYRLLAWVVMPNHVHVVFQPLDGVPMSEIVQAWKSVSARRINRLTEVQGRVWQPEYFDRAIRGERHLTIAVEYVEGNPVKAGLVEEPGQWRYGSAWVGRTPRPLGLV